MAQMEYDLLRRITSERCTDESFTQEEHVILRSMAKKHWITWTTTGRIVLREAGQCALLEYEELLQKRAEEDAQNKADQEARDQAADERWRKDAVRSWTQFWLGVLFSVIGFVSGVIVEHFFTVWDMFVHLF